MRERVPEGGVRRGRRGGSSRALVREEHGGGREDRQHRRKGPVRVRKAVSRQTRLYKSKNKEERRLVERIYDLKAVLQGKRNRAKAPDSEKFILDDIAEHIKFLEGKVEALSKKLEEMVRGNGELNAKYDRLLEMKGVGRASAPLLVVMLPELGECSRREIAALSGVAPIARDGGTYSGHRFTRRGRPNVKRALFMCAMSASLHDPSMREFRLRLVARGKPKKVALVAVMRKLIVIANSRCKELKCNNIF